MQELFEILITSLKKVFACQNKHYSINIVRSKTLYEVYTSWHSILLF